MLNALIIGLSVLSVAYIAFWFAEARKHRDTPDPGMPGVEHLGMGYVANFFDALGIGSFATTTTYVRIRKLMADELIPGSLNVGYALPTATQALMSFGVIQVDPMTLVLMIATAVAGSWFGAGVVSKMPRRAIQVGMGIALLVAAGFFLARLLKWMPSSDTGTLDLQGLNLWVGLAGSFFLGSIMPLGIGYYAPCMILVSALGMNQKAAFPIMMGACAFLMPVASMNFIRARRYSLKNTIGMAVGGVFGSAMALWLVSELDLDKVRWLVMFVVTYTGISLLRTAAIEKAKKA